ncbi:hypothetical protein RHS04_08585 [Rhizoctonia solani]|uniref:Uncharacterized protein n=1 Tax=Rhizoctonia solani TaxID=456999 RepID=A0A8H7H0A3_9AGAM|nr:hypothetical protein RHS04_08585 [Rhizoctonia solani]
MGTKTSERQGEYKNDERARLITFGSIPGTETLEGSLVLKGTGKRKGALTNKAPPIQRISNLRIEYPQDTHKTADARNNTDASDKDNRDAAPQETTKRTADRALGVPTTPDAANRATSTSRVPKTPNKHKSALGMSVGYSGQSIYITACTSRTYRTESGNEESTHEKPQYVIVDNSPSHAYKYCKGRSKVNSESNRKSEPVGISWFEEMRKAKNLLKEEELPELDANWYRDHWSWLQYLSAPDTESGNQLDNTGSVSVNALIYKVSKNNMLTDEEYERLLEMLRNQERLRTAREYKPSQTSGAGLSGAHCIPSVTLEEVEDKGKRFHIVISSDKEHESEYKLALKGKGKRKGRIKKTRPRTSLGVIIDKVQRDPDISYTECVKSQSLRESQPADRIPEGFSSGGYVQAIKSGRYSHRDERPKLAGTPSDPNDDQSESSSSSSLDSKSNNDEDKTWGNPNRQIMKLLANLKKENKKLKQKMKDQVRSGYKAQTPKTYKGEEPDIKAYEQFLFKYNTWICEAGLTRDESI